jgi:hypothetical protein
MHPYCFYSKERDIFTLALFEKALMLDSGITAGYSLRGTFEISRN